MQEQFEATGLDAVPARPLPRPDLLMANPAQRVTDAVIPGDISGDGDDGVSVRDAVIIAVAVLTFVCIAAALAWSCYRKRKGPEAVAAAAGPMEAESKETAEAVVPIGSKGAGGADASFMDMRMPPPPFAAAFAMTESESSATQTTSKGLSSGTVPPQKGGAPHGGRPPPNSADAATSLEGGPGCDKLLSSAIEPAAPAGSTAAAAAVTPSAAVKDRDSEALTRVAEGDGPTMLEARSRATTAAASGRPRPPLSVRGLKSESGPPLRRSGLAQRRRTPQ